MELNLIIKKKMPVQSGTSQSGNTWRKQEVLGETFCTDKPKNVVFTIFGDNIDKIQLSEGIVYTVSVDIESRSFTDRSGAERWFTNVNAWKAEPYPSQAAVPGASTPVQPSAPVYQAPVASAPSAAPQPDPDLPF